MAISHLPTSARLHIILSAFLFHPVFTLPSLNMHCEHALRLAVQNLCSHDSTRSTVLYAFRKLHVQHV